jgi:VanZ family protein
MWLKYGALIGAWCGCLAVAILSLVPGEYRPHVPGLSHKIEHVLAYLVLGALTAVAARHRLNPYLLTLGLVAYAGVLELGQLFIPNRDASLEDFAASAAGAIIGISLTALALRLLARM